MNKRPSILFLAPQIPWPLDTGGKIRTFHLLSGLCRQHDVRLLCYGDVRREAQSVAALEKRGIALQLVPPPRFLEKGVLLGRGLLGPLPYNVRKYQSKEMVRAVKKIVQRREATVIHCDHVHLAPLAADTGLPFVIDEHNVETIIWDRFARDASQGMAKRALFYQQAFWLRRTETRLARQAELVLTCSEVDQATLQEMVGPHSRVSIQVVPNGVDVDYFSEPGPADPTGHLVYTGSMDWAPNESAVLSFLDDIWPTIVGQNPGSKFVVVGRNPSPRLRARAAQAKVQVTGTVPDLRPYLRQALALVVPIRVGGGTRLKILEAFAAGVPVISTAVGIEGISAEPEVHYLQAQSAADFAEAVRRMREEKELAPRLTENGYRLATENYRWSVLGQRLAEEYGRRFG